jgi:hypothetical protein
MLRAVSTFENATKNSGLIAVLLPRGEAAQGSFALVWSNWRVEGAKCGVAPEREGQFRLLTATGKTASICTKSRKKIVDRLGRCVSSFAKCLI